MRQPRTKPKGAGFIRFFPSDLPPGTRLRHKLRHGNVDLELVAQAPHESRLSRSLGRLLEPDMKLVRAAKALALRITVPVINTAADFGDQLEAVMGGLRAASRLHEWSKDHSTELKRLIG